MTRSIRWKLLTWYTLILAVFATLFGVASYLNVRRAMERLVDGQLAEQAKSLADVLIPDENGRFLVELTPELIERFRQEGDGAPYYQIWDVGGGMVDGSHPERRIPRPDSPGSRTRDGFRELTVAASAGAWVLLGRSIEHERRQLRELATAAAAIGLVTLACMLAGGWFLTSRALAPIGRISAAAAAVSASNLSQRIDVECMETELAQLARTMNSTFDRLQESFDRQAQFTADASHELRTPLSVIVCQSDLTLKRDRSPDEYRESLNRIRRAAGRMRAVVEGLLTLARADAGQLSLAREPIDFRSLVEDTCSLLLPLADDKQVAVAVDADPVWVVGDGHRLGEAVGNLVSNALHHNSARGSVSVSLRADNGSAMLTVADTGWGIADASQCHVFNRFYRADEARSQMATGGCGLGLAITKWIVEAHGGTIDFSSQEGKGSTFIVRLKAVGFERPPR